MLRNYSGWAWRHIGSIGLILVLLAGAAASGNTIDLSVTGLPATYAPGSPLTFQVDLSGAADLNSYDVGLDLTSSKGTAGTDFYFTGSPSTNRPPDSADTYVFGSNLSVSPVGFLATPSLVLSTNTAVLSLSDFLSSGGSVADASPNTMLATVVVDTTPSAGNLTLSFDGTALELLTPGGQTVPGTVSSPNPPTVTATVPEPSSFALLCASLGLAAIAVGWRRRSLRRPA